MTCLLILRPEPGASETVARARSMGLEALATPLFSIRPLKWEPPGAETVDGVMLTSANAVRHAGVAVAAFTPLPCYAVGEATAEAARAAGFTRIQTGPSDGAALLGIMAQSGVTRVLHLCGRDHIPLENPSVSILRRFVYAAEPVRPLPADAAAALRGGALVALHSPRAAAHFAALVDAAGLDRGSIALAAISQAAADAAGEGWRDIAVANAPRDAALLELAEKLCKTEQVGQG